MVPRHELLLEKVRLAFEPAGPRGQFAIGANLSAIAIAGSGLAGRSHYYIGNDPRAWRTAVPHYARIRYRDVYPGIDAVY